jgi:hypothetical protein
LIDFVLKYMRATNNKEKMPSQEKLDIFRHYK